MTKFSHFKFNTRSHRVTRVFTKGLCCCTTKNTSVSLKKKKKIHSDLLVKSVQVNLFSHLKSATLTVKGAMLC